MSPLAAQRDASGSPDDRGLDNNVPVASAGNTPAQHWLQDWLRSVGIAILLFLLIRTFFVEAFRIPTASMQNTLLAGDFVLVNKLVYGAQIPFTPLRLPALARPVRGDVVVFAPPHDPDRHYVKRLVAMAGDTVEMRNKELYVNGVRIDEPYVQHSDSHDLSPPGLFWQCRFMIRRTRTTDCHPSRDNWGPLVVPADCYLVLGDNRDDSEDSRYWGFVPRAAIRGRPLVVYYSFEPGTPRALTWLTRVRWQRIGLAVE